MIFALHCRREEHWTCARHAVVKGVSAKREVKGSVCSMDCGDEVEQHHILHTHVGSGVEKKRWGVVRHKDLHVKPNLPPARSDQSISPSGGTTHC